MILGPLLLFLFFVFLSAYFAGAEMAFVSANYVRIRNLADEGSVKAKNLLKLHDDPENFLSSILIAVNLVNILSTATLTYILNTFLNIHNELIVTLIMLPILVVLAEWFPKDYARIKSISFLMSQSSVLKFLAKILHYPSHILLKIMKFLFPKISHSGRSIFVSEDEFRALIKEETISGVVEPHEEKFIQTILDFERIPVHSVMTPVSDVPMIEISSKVEDIKALARQRKTKMVLVYEEDPSIIVGMIYVFDVLLKGNNQDGLHDYLRSPLFIKQKDSLESAFLNLQQKRQSFAAVIDDDREVIGVVPIEKLLVGGRKQNSKKSRK